MSGVAAKVTSKDTQPNGRQGEGVLSDPAEYRDMGGAFSRQGDAAKIWIDDMCGSSFETMAFRFLNHRFRPHTHDSLMLGLIESGTKAFDCKGRLHVASPGSISLVNPGDLHSGWRMVGEELRYRALYIPEELLSLAGDFLSPRASGTSVGFLHGVIRDPLVYLSLMRAHDAIVCREIRLAREHLLLEGIRLLVGRYGGRRTNETSTKAPTQVTRAKDLINAQHAQDLSVAEVARLVGMSSYHLMREFRRHVGMPMHAYQIQVRVSQAKRLLVSGMAVSDVAQQVGFADQSHLSKRFKDLVGLPPAAYRRGVFESATT